MSDYISREAARQCIHKWLADIFGIDDPELTVLDKRINAIPAADVRPVVCCKDCEHVEPSRNKHKDELPFFCKIHRENFKDGNEFCCYGKRKQEEET